MNIFVSDDDHIQLDSNLKILIENLFRPQIRTLEENNTSLLNWIGSGLIEFRLFKEKSTKLSSLVYRWICCQIISNLNLNMCICLDLFWSGYGYIKFFTRFYFVLR